MKVVDTPTLIRLVNESRKANYSRLLPPEVEAELDPVGKHVLSQPMIHGDMECVRATAVMLKLRDKFPDAHETSLDFSLASWNSLPEYKRK